MAAIVEQDQSRSFRVNPGRVGIDGHKYSATSDAFLVVVDIIGPNAMGF